MFNMFGVGFGWVVVRLLFMVVVRGVGVDWIIKLIIVDWDVCCRVFMGGYLVK